MKMTSLFTHPQAILGVSDFILSDEYNRIYTEQNYKRNTFVFAPISHEPELKDLMPLFHCMVRYGTVRLSSGRFAFPPQFSTAIEWAGLFTRRYNYAASTAVTSS